MNVRFLWRALKTRYRDQAAELAALGRAIRPGDTVCDIGANKGSYLYWLSRWVGSSGRVVAFEPQRALVQYLENVCASLRLSNVTVEPKAVYSSCGEMQLYAPAGEVSPSATLVSEGAKALGWTAATVPVVTLDEYFAPEERVSAIKIDVEGAELGVFRGAERILRQQSPLLVFESEQRHLDAGSPDAENVDEVFDFLHNCGYQGSFVAARRLLPTAEFRVNVHQKQRAGEEFWNDKDYCNNFVFRKSA